MSITHVQEASNTSGGNTTGSLSVSFSPTVAGNLLVLTVVTVGLPLVGGGIPCTVSDGSNTYVDSGVGMQGWFWEISYIPLTAGGAIQTFYVKDAASVNSVTVSTSYTDDGGIGGVFFHEYSGVDIVSPLDGHCSSNNLSNYNPTSSTIATTGTDLIYCAGLTGNTGSPSAGSGFTGLQSGSWSVSGFDYPYQGYVATCYFLEEHVLSVAVGTNTVGMNIGHGTGGSSINYGSILGTAFKAALSNLVDPSGMTGMVW